jgi:hypothetical protein
MSSRDGLFIPCVNNKMTPFRGLAIWAKMTLLGGKLTAQACYPTKKVSKAEELTFLYTNIVYIAAEASTREY